MTSSYPDLTSFKALSFDCYGTLIDWEAGIHKSLEPLASQLAGKREGGGSSVAELSTRLNEIVTGHQTRTPRTPYNEILAMSLSELGSEFNIPITDSISEPFGNAVGTWGPFPDTVEALQRLARRYKLIILSNVDNTNIAATTDRQLSPARFDAVYTAQDIGSYKPALANFEYLRKRAREELGVDSSDEKRELLHVACSLWYDLVPAKKLGIPGVWISRGAHRDGAESISGSLKEFGDKVDLKWRFDTMGEFADEVDRQFAEKEKTTAS